MLTRSSIVCADARFVGKRRYGVWGGVISFVAMLLLLGARAEGGEVGRCLVVVFDGLRPEYIQPDVMPHLHRLGERGAVGVAHHAVFPTVTRVNATSIATGSYPASHGILDNTIYLPRVMPDSNIDTGDAELLLQVEDRTNGGLLTAPSMGELLDQAGKRLFVTTSSSTGAAYLLNHKGLGGGVWNTKQFVLPVSARETAVARIGAFPKEEVKASPWAVEGCMAALESETPPDVTVLWLTDIDAAGHRHGVGAPQALEAARHLDGELGRLLGWLEERGLREKINIFVTTDHGFSNYTGEFAIAALLAEHGLEKRTRVVSGRQIYVHDRDPETIRRIVALLRETDWAGAIFTRAAVRGSHEGFVPGTLSFDSIFWNHPRSADILVDTNWTDAKNAQGYPGTTTTKGSNGGHGSSSPFDIQIRLIADGPDIRRGSESAVPTGNIDIAATICFLQGIERPKSMHGRVLKELLRDGPKPEEVAVERKTHAVAAGGYRLELSTSRVGETVYVDWTRVRRDKMP